MFGTSGSRFAQREQSDGVLRNDLEIRIDCFGVLRQRDHEIDHRLPNIRPGIGGAHLRDFICVDDVEVHAVIAMRDRIVDARVHDSLPRRVPELHGVVAFPIRIFAKHEGRLLRAPVPVDPVVAIILGLADTEIGEEDLALILEGVDLRCAQAGFIHVDDGRIERLRRQRLECRVLQLIEKRKRCHDLPLCPPVRYGAVSLSDARPLCHARCRCKQSCESPLMTGFEPRLTSGYELPSSSNERNVSVSYLFVFTQNSLLVHGTLGRHRAR